MQNIGLILLVFAFVFACISARVSAVGGWSLLSIAVACWIAADLIGGAGRAFGLH